MTGPSGSLSRRQGILVYAILIGVTILEVGVVLMGIPNAAGVIIMLGTTVAKIMLIALYFMHMKSDKALVWLLPVVPVMLAVFFVLMLFPDIVYHLPLQFH